VSIQQHQGISVEGHRPGSRSPCSARADQHGVIQGQQQTTCNATRYYQAEGAHADIATEGVSAHQLAADGVADKISLAQPGSDRIVRSRPR